MRVHLGSDHAGLELKEHLLNWLADQGHEAVDHGPFVHDADDDYPVFCLRAAEAVAADWQEGDQSLGVVVGGSGNIAGVSLGAFLLAYLPERFREFAEWRFLVFGLALVIVMLLRPQGLIPSKRRARELKDRQEEVPAGV